MKMNHAEVIVAAADAIALACGFRTTNQHPFAEELARNPLSSLARACAIKKRPDLQEKPIIQVIAFGMSTGDFSRALADGVKALAIRRFDNQAQHRSFCSEIELADFRPMESIGVDTSLDLGLPVGEFEEFDRGTAVDYAGNEIELRTYGRVLSFTRQLIINDNIGAVKAIVANAGAAGARTEARLVSEALESDQPMSDEGIPFHATYGNLVAAALDASSLAQATGKLRLQATPEGNHADFEAAHLVVAADIEFSARKLIHESGSQITVSALSNLPAGRWYLLASPDVAQTIAVGKLRGSKSPLLVEMRAIQRFESDATEIKLRADLAASLQSRIGIIRGGV